MNGLLVLLVVLVTYFGIVILIRMKHIVDCLIAIYRKLQ